MDAVTTVDEEEALRNIQTQGENLIDGTATEIKQDVSDETVTAEDDGVVGNNNRGDEGVLEGVAVGGIDVYSSDSDEEEDTGIVIHAGRTTSAAPRRHTPHFDRSSKVYLRPQALTPAGPVSYEDTEELSTKIPVKDETKRLRFTHHRTAFDVDIDNLESHPWRNKNVDLSDYFNYGFSEATWQLYSERQLLLRGRLGLAPYHPAPVVASLPAKTDAVLPTIASSSVISSTPAVAFIPPLAISYPPVQAPISAPFPAIQPPRPVFIAPTTIVVPPVSTNQPPPPPRAPVSVHIPESYPISTTPAPAPAPPIYPPVSAPPSSYIPPLSSHGTTSWPGILGPGIPGTMPNISGMPPMNMMGRVMGWDPYNGMPSQHAHGAYGFSGPGQGGMMTPYGMQGGLPMGMMSMDGQGSAFDNMRMEMNGYQDQLARGEDAFNGSGADGWGNEQNRRERRQESALLNRGDAGNVVAELTRIDSSRGERETKKRSRSRDRELKDRGDRGRDNNERDRGRVDDDRTWGEKRRRDDGDDRRDVSPRTGTDRDRDGGRSSRGDLDKRRR